MNFAAVTLHQKAIETIIDAAIPNKAQNKAIKTQIGVEIDTLMNRIASGWLDDLGKDAITAEPKPPKLNPPEHDKLAEE